MFNCDNCAHYSYIRKYNADQTEVVYPTCTFYAKVLSSNIDSDKIIPCDCCKEHKYEHFMSINSANVFDEIKTSLEQAIEYEKNKTHIEN